MRRPFLATAVRLVVGIVGCIAYVDFAGVDAHSRGRKATILNPFENGSPDVVARRVSWIERAIGPPFPVHFFRLSQFRRGSSGSADDAMRGDEPFAIENRPLASQERTMQQPQAYKLSLVSCTLWALRDGFLPTLLQPRRGPGRRQRRSSRSREISGRRVEAKRQERTHRMFRVKLMGQ